jgi:DNA-binding response OmpR family regulator
VERIGQRHGDPGATPAGGAARIFIRVRARGTSHVIDQFYVAGEFVAAVRSASTMRRRQYLCKGHKSVKELQSSVSLIARRMLATETNKLEFLMSHPGRTFNRTQLLAQAWGGDSEVDERTVDVNVQRLRKILAEPGYEAYIQTVRGFGYRFVAPSLGRAE